MDSRIVNRRIRVDVWPGLKELGFSQFSGRSAWRHRARKIDVVNFQSFNSYLAGSLGCTTYSFVINLGCYFLDVPSQFEPGVIKEKDGRLVPEEYVCHFRRSLEKSLRQKELPRRSIWYLDPDGRYLDAVIQDAVQAIRKSMSWFDRYESREVALRVLLHDKEQEGRVFGFGAFHSPQRNFVIGHLALALNDRKLARTHLQAALDSGRFPNNTASMSAALQHMDDRAG